MCPPLTLQRFLNNDTLKRAAEQGYIIKRWERDHAAVLAIQLALLDLRYSMPVTTHNGRRPPDGVYGEETFRTVRQFQHDQLFPPHLQTGFVGTKTLCAMEEALRGPGSGGSELPQGLVITPPSNELFQILKLRGCGHSAPGGIGDDFTFCDYPPRSLDVEKVRAIMDLKNHVPANTFITTLRSAFTLKAGVLGSAAVQRYIDQRSGEEWRHDVGTDLSELAKQSPAVQTAIREVNASIEQQVRKQVRQGRVDWRTFQVKSGELTWIEFQEARDGSTLFALIHGSQGVTASIRGFSVSQALRTYSATVRLDICDNFGFGEGDIHPERSWTDGAEAVSRISWLLQHDSGRDFLQPDRPPRTECAVPFVIRIFVEDNISGRF